MTFSIESKSTPDGGIRAGKRACVWCSGLFIVLNYPEVCRYVGDEQEKGKDMER